MAGPLVSVVVTAKGETPARLARLVGAVAAQDLDRPVEIVLAMPPDEDFIAPHVGGSIVDIRKVANPRGDRSAGLNLAIEAARGELVCRLDARSSPPADYVRRCVQRLEADDSVGIVGGVQRPYAVVPGIVARGVARALANPWALGGAAYRRGVEGGPVDTVYLGAFRRTQVIDLGGYDERLDANEDFELAQRFRDRGYQVWLEPDLFVDYEARSTIGAVWRQYTAFGRSKVRFWRLTGRRPNTRQVMAVALAAVAGVAVIGSLRHPRRLALGATAVLSGAFVVDHLADPGEASPAARAVSVATNGAAITGWLAGLVAEALHPNRHPSLNRR